MVAALRAGQEGLGFMRKEMIGLLGAVLVLSLTATSAFAAKAVKINANLVMTCTNCDTNVGAPGQLDGRYSLQADGSGYSDGNGIKSQILTNNSVYNLDTMNTLVNGHVGAGTRTVLMHFFSPVEGQFPGHNLPGCWNGNYDQEQAVNWAVFARNSVNFPLMQTNTPYAGWARLDFNVRNGSCDGQVYRFYLQWFDACIVRTGANTWTVTSDSCGRQTNYGEATLRGQGGKNGQTINYGDWRMPFKLTMARQ